MGTPTAGQRMTPVARINTPEPHPQPNLNRNIWVSGWSKKTAPGGAREGLLRAEYGGGESAVIDEPGDGVHRVFGSVCKKLKWCGTALQGKIPPTPMRHRLSRVKGIRSQRMAMGGQNTLTHHARKRYRSNPPTAVKIYCRRPEPPLGGKGLPLRPACWMLERFTSCAREQAPLPGSNRYCHGR